LWTIRHRRVEDQYNYISKIPPAKQNCRKTFQSTKYQMKENTGQVADHGPNGSKRHNPMSYEKDTLMMHVSPAGLGSKPTEQHTSEQYILASKANISVIDMVQKADPFCISF